MADVTHDEILLQGVDVWNRWRADNPDIRPDLARAILEGEGLSGANLVDASLNSAELDFASLNNADLSGADLMGANLGRASLFGANLSGALMNGAHLTGADLTRADLTRARMNYADLGGANLSGADLTGAFLIRAQLIGTKVEGATLDRAWVYGANVWDTKGTPTSQVDLVISSYDEPRVTADDIEVAQFMNLVLHNDKLRRVIDVITSKVVLILGRFTDERKAVLDALRDELRGHNLTPVLFDFEIPADRDITETVTLLARMARFIVADLTDPASIPMELQAIAPDLAVPIQAIIHRNQEPFSMFKTLKKYRWVLPPYEYTDLNELLASLTAEVIAPAEAEREALGSGLS